MLLIVFSTCGENDAPNQEPRIMFLHVWVVSWRYILKPFAKLYKFALRAVFKDEFLWKNKWEKICRVWHFGKRVINFASFILYSVLVIEHYFSYVKDVWNIKSFIHLELGSQHSYNKHNTAYRMFVCMVFTHSSVCIRNLTRSLRSLVRYKWN